MGINSYRILEKEWDAFCLPASLTEADYMHGHDISWISQVAPFIEEFSKEGDCILDPFAGLGTTLLACGLLGRNSIGIELDETRFRHLQQRMDNFKDHLKSPPQLVHGDTLQADYPKDIDLVVTNFPYFHASEEKGRNNLYAISDYENYLQAIEQAIIKCEKALKEEGYIIVFTENIRRVNGEMIPQAYDICKLLQRHFILKDERILLYPKPSLPEGDSTCTNRAHEYVFIAKKQVKETDLTPYFDTLQKIESAGIPYVTVGTFGLYNSDAACVLDNPPHDADIYTTDTPENLSALINFLKADSYKLYSWQDAVDENFQLAKLKGRYYLRALKTVNGNDIQLDITYEHEENPFDGFYKRSYIANGVRIASTADICRMMETRLNEKDKTIICRVGKLGRSK